MLSLTVIATAFALVLPVELPDKTLFASLVLATRFPPLPVFVGVGTAFGLQVAIAVTAGSLLSLLPEALVSGVVAALFLVGAVIRPDGSSEIARGRTVLGAGDHIVVFARPDALTAARLVFGA